MKWFLLLPLTAAVNEAAVITGQPRVPLYPPPAYAYPYQQASQGVESPAELPVWPYGPSYGEPSAYRPYLPKTWPPTPSAYQSSEEGSDEPTSSSEESEEGSDEPISSSSESSEEGSGEPGDDQ